MSGGDWKDLVKAAKTNNKILAEYHLNKGVDPNFQHPEYFTSPVFEAIRHGNIDILDILLKAGGSLVQLEELSDMNPLEVALDCRRHDVVDYLLEELKGQRAGIHTVLISGLESLELIQSIAVKGHYVLIDNTFTTQEEVHKMRRITGNYKIDLTQMVIGELKDVTHWMIGDSSSLLDTLADYKPAMTKAFEKVLVVISGDAPTPQLQWLLQNHPTEAIAIMTRPLPNWLGIKSWEDSWNYKENAWITSSWWLMMHYGTVMGEIYNYKTDQVASDYFTPQAPEMRKDWDENYYKKNIISSL